MKVKCTKLIDSRGNQEERSNWLTVGKSYHVYAGGEPVAIDLRGSNDTCNGTNSFYYLLSDHEGSISAITNCTGAVVVGESFAAYGNRRSPTTWSGAPTSADLSTIAGITRHGYTFQDTLGQMGLNDMVGRVQDAITGRFLSADPNIPDPTNPQSYNRYSYTVNNPLTYTDPTGFESCDSSGGNDSSCDQSSLQNGNSSGAGPSGSVTLPTITIDGAPYSGINPSELGPPVISSAVSLDSISVSSPFPSLSSSIGGTTTTSKSGSKQPQQSNSQPQKPTQCTNGVSPSRAYNPNVGRNIFGGTQSGFLTVGIGVAFIASQFIGVGEVADVAVGAYEGAEALGTALEAADQSEAAATLLEAPDPGGVASIPAVAGLNGGAIGAAAGATAGLAATAPTCP